MPYQFQNFHELLKILSQSNMYQRAIQEAQKKYRIKHYRIEKLKPHNIRNLLKKNHKKEKIVNLEQNNYAWAQGQLKVFVWFLVGYCFIKKIDISEMSQNDFIFFNEIFEQYSLDFLHYQANFLLKSSEKVAWSQREADLLNEIIRLKFHQKNWNTVAYELYQMSGKTVFRTPKQCRQRWLNHQDPIKIRSEWSNEQDLALLSFVKQMGKKWSAIAKQMKTRTEHMVKNRYTSLVKKMSKLSKGKGEKQLLEMILKLKFQEKTKTEVLDQTESKVGSVDFGSDLSNQANDNNEMEIQLKEIENQQYLEEDNAKRLVQSLKTIEQIQPCNLVMEQIQIMGEGSKHQLNEERYDFFSKDNDYPTFNYLEFFY